jgi:hypothetical protein
MADFSSLFLNVQKLINRFNTHESHELEWVKHVLQSLDRMIINIVAKMPLLINIFCFVIILMMVNLDVRDWVES